VRNHTRLGPPVVDQHTLVSIRPIIRYPRAEERQQRGRCDPVAAESAISCTWTGSVGLGPSATLPFSVPILRGTVLRESVAVLSASVALQTSRCAS